MVALAATAVGRVGSDSLTFGNRQHWRRSHDLTCRRCRPRGAMPPMRFVKMLDPTCGHTHANDPAGQLIDCDGHWHATRIPGRPCTAPGGGTVTRAG